MEKEIRNLIKRIKEKRELSSLDDDFILFEIRDIIESYPSVSSLGPREMKLIVKEARARLRRSSGMFHTGKLNGSGVLDEEKVNALVNFHSSTRERLSDYPLLQEVLSSLKVRSILDIGCGLNPLALASQDVRYYACDINIGEVKIIQEYFKSRGIDGKAFIFNVNNSDISLLPNADICLLWKVLDLIKNRERIKELIKNVPCKFILAGFSIKTLSGKPMRRKRRFWFERLISGIGLSLSVFYAKNEIFYLVKRNKL